MTEDRYFIDPISGGTSPGREKNVACRRCGYGIRAHLRDRNRDVFLCPAGQFEALQMIAGRRGGKTIRGRMRAFLETDNFRKAAAKLAVDRAEASANSANDKYLRDLFEQLEIGARKFEPQPSFQSIEFSPIVRLGRLDSITAEKKPPAPPAVVAGPRRYFDE